MSEMYNLVLSHLRNWCAYQERCQSDVREKLKNFQDKISFEETSQIISSLISDNYLNEERFAATYASGKFRIKKWGRAKIKMMLRQKKISDFSINKALKAIDDSEYLNTLRELIEKKMTELKSEKNKIKKHYKVLRFSQSKGFETDLILDVLKED